MHGTKISFVLSNFRQQHWATKMCDKHVSHINTGDKSKASKGNKRPSDDSLVHSANEWERSDLGDEGRKQKFLRLMGADKKDHHGLFIIGDQQSGHGNSRDDVHKVTSELEQQYTQGMEHRVSGKARSHTGLGFVAPTLNDPVEEATGKTREEGKGSSEEEKLQVHSSNDWEHANLGDEGRKQKFLKLMGAGKKEHHGQFIIGEHEPTQSGIDVKKVEGELEDQFREGAEQKPPGCKGSRTGYGFPHDESDTTEINEKDTGDAVQSSRVSGSSSPTDTAPALINFVKGSS